MLSVIGCITQLHDLRLVALAALICLMACFTAVTMLSRGEGAGRRLRLVWLVGAGVAFGGGVWATHFVAMLAFRPGLPVQYRLVATLLSALLAMAGAAGAFALLRGLPRRAPAVAAAAAALCAAVGAMHYAGTAAMQMPAMLVLDGRFVAASLLAGLAPMAVALWLQRRAAGTRARLHVAAWLTLGICALHFVGMAGTRFIPMATVEADGAVVASDLLAVAVAGVSAMLLLLSLSGSLIDEQFASRAARETRRLRQLVNVTSQGIIIQAGGVVLDVNDAACALLGRPAAELVGGKLLRLLARHEQDMVRTQLRAPCIDAVELNLLLPDASLRPVEVTSRPIEHDGRPAVVIALRDLTEAKRAEARIQHLAHHDGLTDLPNRLLFNDRLMQALEQATRQGSRLAVLCLDLDRFKPVNDLLGHASGDALLALVAERLRAGCRTMDTVARMGGDEFAIVQPLASQPEASAALARRLVEGLAEPFELDGHTIEIGVSVGIALFPDDGATAARLLMHADTALYRAKQDGRGVFRFFEAAMDERLQERRRLEQDLRAAIGLGQMELNYQPLFDTASRGVVGYEALVRWNHPLRGRIPPGDFIPLAETSGLIVPLGRLVLETACAQAVGWPDGLPVAVNLSPAQFRQPDLPAMVADILHATGLPAHRLELEVTEGVLIDDPDRALALLTALKRQGVRISLDDFGTGYSSLSYLRRFPFDKIKIDRSFVSDLGEAEDAGAIIRAIVALAHSLRMTVTAEGVETQAQLDMLQAQNCNQVQGFLLGRPVPAAALPWPAEAGSPLLAAD